MGPGRTIATSTARSSRVRGRVRRSIWIWARLSIWNSPTVSPRQMRSYTAASAMSMRERSGGRPPPERAATSSTHSSTSDSMPSAKKSILMKRASSGILVPLAHDAVLHRGPLERHELHERPARDDHPADVLRHVAGEPRDLLRQLAQLLPQWGGHPTLEAGKLLQLVRQSP